MPFSPLSIPTLPSLSLSDDEKRLVEQISRAGLKQRESLMLDEAYYLGAHITKNLRIAIPPELEFLETVLGWGAVPVDPIVERLAIDGFRLPGGTDVDLRLSEVWDDNGMGAEQSLAFTDALVMRRSYLLIGSGDNGPRITVESPLNTSVLWAADGVTPRAAFIRYADAFGSSRADLVLPNQTISLESKDSGPLEIVNRDEHDFDFVPIVRLANKPRTHDRDGQSEISVPMRSSIDRAARTLLGLEVAREIYSVPQKTILGATESDFVNSDGTAKSAWDVYMTRVLGLERDEEGNLPQVVQATPYDPSVFTKLIEMEASQFSGMAAATPQDLGLHTQGNPTSAEALEVSQDRRNRRAALKQRSFAVPLERAMQMAMRFQNGGALPDEFRRIEIDWMPLIEPSLNGVSDGLSKQVDAGIIPPTSDVTLKRAGYSAVERAQLAQDRVLGDGQRTLNAIADQGNGDAGAAG